MVRQWMEEFHFHMTEVLSSDMKAIVVSDRQDMLLDENVIHMHSFWELVYVFKGAVAVSLDRQSYVVNRNEALLIPPFLYHQVKMEEGTQASRILFSFEKMKCQGENLIFDEIYSSFPARDVFRAENVYIGELLKKLFRNQETDKPGRESRVQASIVELIFSLYDLLKPEQFEGFDSSFPQFGYWEYRCAVEMLLCRHYMTDISQEDLCNRIGISTPSLTRVLSMVYGQSFGNLKLEMKIRNAKRLILETNLSIGEIGKQCGYTSARGFLIAFRRSEHCTPSEYRKKMKV